MNLYNVLLDNKIPFTLLETADNENVIYYNSFTEHFFGVGEFNTKTKPVILEYTGEDGNQYVTTSVTLEDGTCYNNVRFRLVKQNNPGYCTVNLNLTTDKEQVEFVTEQPEIIQEEVKPTKPPTFIPPEPDIKPVHKEITLKALREQYPSNLNLKPVYFDKVPFIVLEDNNTENTLYCNNFQDYLFNVGIFQTKTKELILEYTTQDNEKYVTTELTFEDGSHYRYIKFRVVICENSQVPFSTVNFNTLGRKLYNEPPKLQPEVIEEEIILPQPVIEDSKVFEEVINQRKAYEEATKKALQKEKQLQKEVEQTKKLKVLYENTELIQNQIDSYKQELLEEYLNTIKKQSDLLQLKANQSIEKAEHIVHKNLLELFDRYKNKLTEVSKNDRVKQLEYIEKEINVHIDSSKQEVQKLISEFTTSGNNEINKTLQDKTKELESYYDKKILVELEAHKEKLFEEFKILSNETIITTLDKKTKDTQEIIVNIFAEREEKLTQDFQDKLTVARDEITSLVNQFKYNDLPEITSNIEQLEERVKVLVEAKEKAKISDFTDKQKEYIATTAQYWARRILDLGGGGGSVAVQYAKGGTMDGSLSVNNLYPNNNNGEIGTPSNRWGRIYANTIDSLSSNIVVELSGFFVDGDFTVNGVISAVGGSSNNWNSVYSTVQTNSAGWESVESSVYANSGRWESNWTTTNTNSANWNSVYTTTSLTSARWESNWTTTNSNSALWGSVYTTSNTNSGRYESNYTTTNTNSANWNSVYSSFNSNSGRYDSNYTTTNTFSGLWQSVYTTVSAFSASWEESADIAILQNNITNIAVTSGNWNVNYNTTIANSALWSNWSSVSSTYATINFANGKFLPLSGGRIDGNVVINGSLTALGDTYFVNTVFTTTSAVSVINTGVGPALYVFQAAGPYDVASFYDGDGVEVLHVGNAQGGGNPFGKVGINTGNPTMELTVRGSISASGSIVAAGYNDTNWNTAYTNLVNNSAAYLSGFDSSLLTVTSGKWDSNYTTTNTFSGLWQSVYTTVSAFSASWEESADITVLQNSITNIANTSGNWDSNYTTTNTNSSRWQSVYTSVNSGSANYILDGGNTKGANLLIGTNDSFELGFETNNVRRLFISNTGALTGYNPQVAFNLSFAAGTNSFAINAGVARGTRSFAQGNGSTATNSNAVAMGSNTRATGTASFTVGATTSATAINAFAEGSATLASGSQSHAEGNLTIASNTNAHAEGLGTLASGIASHAEGEDTIASNSQAHAEGQQTIASGPYSHAEGYLTVASGQRSHAEGYNTQAQNFHSHSEGRDTIASGTQCHAEGLRSVAGPGGNAHAEGRDCIASGDGSHAEGNNTRASGINAHAEGSDTIAIGDYSHVAGRYAATGLTNTWVWHGDSTATSHISSTKTNQFLVSAAGGVFFPGKVGIGTDSSEVPLTVKGTLSASTVQSGAYIANTGFVISDSGTSWVFSDLDNGKCITFSNTSPITASIPAGLPVGFNIILIQINTGQVQLSAGPGVTINSDGGKTKIASQHSSASLISYAPNIFNLAGNLTT